MGGNGSRDSGRGHGPGTNQTRRRRRATYRTRREFGFAECPECGHVLEFSAHARLGNHLTCPVCNEYLEVVRRRPPELDYVIEDDRWGPKVA